MEPTLAVSCRIQDGKLYVQNTLSNRGDKPLLTYDGAPGVPPDAEWPALDGQIYVSVVDDRVELKRINPPRLPGVNMDTVFMPPISQVLPGEVRSVHFSLQLPLVERSQYTPHFQGAQYQDRVVHNLRLCIGYFWKTDSMQLQPIPGVPKAVRVIGPHGEQKFVGSDCQQQLQVKVRTDDKFQRF